MPLGTSVTWKHHSVFVRVVCVYFSSVYCRHRVYFFAAPRSTWRLCNARCRIVHWPHAGESLRSYRVIPRDRRHSQSLDHGRTCTAHRMLTSRSRSGPEQLGPTLGGAFMGEVREYAIQRVSDNGRNACEAIASMPRGTCAASARGDDAHDRRTDRIGQHGNDHQSRDPCG